MILLLAATLWLAAALFAVALCAAASYGDRDAPAPSPAQRPARPRERSCVRGSLRAGARIRHTHV